MPSLSFSIDLVRTSRPRREMRTVLTARHQASCGWGDMAGEIDDSMVTADSSGPTTATFSSIWQPRRVAWSSSTAFAHSRPCM